MVASTLAANGSKKVGKIVPKVQGDLGGESLFPYKADKFLYVRWGPPRARLRHIRTVLWSILRLGSVPTPGADPGLCILLGRWSQEAHSLGGWATESQMGASVGRQVWWSTGAPPTGLWEVAENTQRMSTEGRGSRAENRWTTPLGLMKIVFAKSFKNRRFLVLHSLTILIKEFQLILNKNTTQIQNNSLTEVSRGS